jgi:Fic family protein
MTAKLFERLIENPIITSTMVMDFLSTTRPTADKAISILSEMGILYEITGKKRDRVFGYGEYLDRLGAGTEK